MFVGEWRPYLVGGLHNSFSEGETCQLRSETYTTRKS